MKSAHFNASAWSKGITVGEVDRHGLAVRRRDRAAPLGRRGRLREQSRRARLQHRVLERRDAADLGHRWRLQRAEGCRRRRWADDDGGGR